MELVFLAAAAVVGAALAFDQFLSKRARLRSAMRRARSYCIRDAPDGLPGKICGRVRTDEAVLKAPLTGTPCVAYHVLATALRGSEPVTVADVQDAVSFLVEDDTGCALVQGARVRLLSSDSSYAIIEQPGPEAAESLRSAISTAPSLRDGADPPHRYRVASVAVGSQVTVLGVCRWEYDPDPAAAGGNYRERPRRLVVGAPRGVSVLVSDDPDVR